MKGRRHLLIVSFVLAITVGFVIWFCWLKKSEAGKQQRVSETSNAEPAASLKDSEPVSGRRGHIPTDAEIKRRDEELIMSRYQSPIAVYGRVVNERGLPIAGATVSIGVTDRPLQHSDYEKTTNELGIFSLTGVQGGAFSVSASKNGYHSSNESKAYRDILAPGKTDAPQPTREHPITLVLRKQEEAVPLLRAKTGQIDVPKAGEPVMINLTNGRIGEGPLQVASWIVGGEERPFDWRYALAIPGGGLVERTGEFDFKAPSDGYRATADIDMPATAQRWSSAAIRAYFAKLPDGRYARFSINFYPSQRRNFVVIESYVNPTPGDRNLEFDPNKVLKPDSK
jgi:hypothetical protein